MLSDVTYLIIRRQASNTCPARCTPVSRPGNWHRCRLCVCLYVCLCVCVCGRLLAQRAPDVPRHLDSCQSPHIDCFDAPRRCTARSFLRDQHNRRRVQLQHDNVMLLFYLIYLSALEIKGLSSSFYLKSGNKARKHTQETYRQKDRQYKQKMR